MEILPHMENKYSSNEKSLKELMQEYVKSPGIRRQYLRVILKEAWSVEMGPMVLKYTKKMVLTKGILTVTVSSAPLRQELILNKIKIIQMLNAAIGEHLIDDMNVI